MIMAYIFIIKSFLANICEHYNDGDYCDAKKRPNSHTRPDRTPRLCCRWRVWLDRDLPQPTVPRPLCHPQPVRAQCRVPGWCHWLFYSCVSCYQSLFMYLLLPWWFINLIFSCLFISYYFPFSFFSRILCIRMG